MNIIAICPKCFNGFLILKDGIGKTTINGKIDLMCYNCEKEPK